MQKSLKKIAHISMKSPKVIDSNNSKIDVKSEKIIIFMDFYAISQYVCG